MRKGGVKKGGVPGQAVGRVCAKKNSFVAEAVHYVMPWITVYAAAFNTTPGFIAATDSNTGAAPLGVRVPCSQWCKVRTLIPSSSANFVCDSPSFCRVA